MAQCIALSESPLGELMSRPGQLVDEEMMGMKRSGWSLVWSVAVVMALAAGLLAFGTLATPAPGRADGCTDAASGGPLPLGAGPCADVLGQEARWLAAITDGDRDTVESILSGNFKHITSEGMLLDRTQEITGIIKQPFTMNPSEQMVDIAGDTAVIHGVNTLIQSGRVLAKERFTDVFVLENGTWMALSAQETAA
jgi:Domain of unknown function (DUF4440)